MPFYSDCWPESIKHRDAHQSSQQAHQSRQLTAQGYSYSLDSSRNSSGINLGGLSPSTWTGGRQRGSDTAEVNPNDFPLGVFLYKNYRYIR